MKRTSVESRFLKLPCTTFCLTVFIGAIATLFSPHLTAQDLPSTNQDYWAVEDAKARAQLPLYKVIPAAKTEELTPANGYPKRDTFLTWHRSHGDNSGIRYSALESD